MKHFIPIALFCILFLSSCSSVKQITITEVISYQAFNDRGIFVTEANTVNTPYTPVGSITASTNFPYKNLQLRPLNLDTAFDEISDRMESIGANAIINFRISFSYISDILIMKVGGMAIHTDEPLIGGLKDVPSPSFKPNDQEAFVIDNIYCLITQSNDREVFVQTNDILTHNQLRAAYKKVSAKKKTIHFYLKKTSRPYKSINAEGMVFDNKTGEMKSLW